MLPRNWTVRQLFSSIGWNGDQKGLSVDTPSFLDIDRFSATPMLVNITWCVMVPLEFTLRRIGRVSTFWSQIGI